MPQDQSVRASQQESASVTVTQLQRALKDKAWLLMVVPLAAGILALLGSYLITPRFIATTKFISPQQQSAATSALASLGSLANLASGGGALRTPADQYVALMQSVTVSDRIIEKFGLMSAYEAKLRIEARERLAKNVVFSVGKKDGLITIDVEDESPPRAANMANQYVEELRLLTSTLAVTEAQQRRVFFERQMRQTKGQLVQAQIALQSSGFGQGSLKAEPKAAAEGYARLKAEVVAAEVRLRALQGALADGTPEVMQQQAIIAALRSQMSKAEQPAEGASGPDYVSRYREFKYQETLFDMLARQYELARVDESREGSLIQVLDVATPPERKSKPRRAMMAISTTLVVGMGLVCWVVASAMSAATRRPPGT